MNSKTSPLYRARSLVLCGLLLMVACGAAACGKRRPPLPPVENIPVVTEELRGSQRGNLITLGWPVSARARAAVGGRSIARIDVYRLAEAPSSPLQITEEEFSQRATLIGSVLKLSIKPDQGDVTYTDQLELTGSPARLRYAVRFVNEFGQRAQFSNFLLIEPTTLVANAPALTGIQLTERAINISWTEPLANIDGSKPANVAGYNVYRTGSTSVPERLNRAPVQQAEFADATFTFGESYSYFVRAISVGVAGEPVESLDSNTSQLNPLDTFAPAAPGTPSVAPGPGRLAVFFPLNRELDVAGYVIYRSLDPALAKNQWTRLNRDLLTRATYQDEAVESGKRYYYYVTAVDKVGNVSGPSEVVSEVAP